MTRADSRRPEGENPQEAPVSPGDARGEDRSLQVPGSQVEGSTAPPLRPAHRPLCPRSPAEEEPTPPSPPVVPWSGRDTWMGVAGLGVWLAAVVGLALLLHLELLAADPGVVVGLGELALLLPVWWLAVRRHQVGWGALGLRSFPVRMIGLGCRLMALSLLFNVVYGSLLALCRLRAQPSLAPLLAELASPGWFLAAGVVAAPIAEEIFFRGFLFAGLCGLYSWRRAAVMSAALFAVIHLQPLACAPLFVLGYLFAYLYYRSGSIWPAILMHVAINALALGAAYTLARQGVPLP